jgi:hypothetical protein
VPVIVHARGITQAAFVMPPEMVRFGTPVKNYVLIAAVTYMPVRYAYIARPDRVRRTVS